jgi:hypothetical protein
MQRRPPIRSRPPALPRSELRSPRDPRTTNRTPACLVSRQSWPLARRTCSSRLLRRLRKAIRRPCRRHAANFRSFVPSHRHPYRRGAAFVWLVCVRARVVGVDGDDIGFQSTAVSSRRGRWCFGAGRSSGASARDSRDLLPGAIKDSVANTEGSLARTSTEAALDRKDGRMQARLSRIPLGGPQLVVTTRCGTSTESLVRCIARRLLRRQRGRQSGIHWMAGFAFRWPSAAHPSRIKASAAGSAADRRA